MKIRSFNIDKDNKKIIINNMIYKKQEYRCNKWVKNQKNEN